MANSLSNQFDSGFDGRTFFDGDPHVDGGHFDFGFEQSITCIVHQDL